MEETIIMMNRNPFLNSSNHILTLSELQFFKKLGVNVDINGRAPNVITVDKSKAPLKSPKSDRLDKVEIINLSTCDVKDQIILEIKIEVPKRS